MSHRRLRSLIALPLLAAALTAATAAGTATSARADTFPRPEPAPATTTDQYWSGLVAERPTLCTKPEKGAVPSARTATSRSWAAITARQGRTRVANLQAWEKKRSANRLVHDANSAFAAGRPDAGLAILLLLDARAPRNPQYLTSTANALVAAEKPLEATAFVNASRATRHYAPTSVGLTGKQALQLAQAGIAFRLGKYASARSTYAAVWSANHEVVEAAEGVVGASTCLDDRTTAISWAGRARVRNDTPVTGPAVTAAVAREVQAANPGGLANPTYDNLGASRVDTDDTFTPWNLQFPGDVPNLIADDSFFHTQATAIVPFPAFNAEYGAIRKVNVHTAGGRWHQAVFDAAFEPPNVDSDGTSGDSQADAYYRATWLPAARAASEAVDPRWDNTFGSMGAIYLAVNKQDWECEQEAQTADGFDETIYENCQQTVEYPMCRAQVDSATQDALTKITNFDTAGKGYHAILEKHASQLGALTNDVHLRNAIMLREQAAQNGQVQSTYDDLYWLSNQLQQNFAECYAAPADQPPAPATTTAGTSSTCPSWLSFSVSIGVVEASISCDSQEVTVATGPIGGFLQVKHSSKKDSVTVFAGGQVGGGVGVASAIGRAGAFVTIDGNGEVSGVGLRATLDLSTTVGPVQATVSNEVDADVIAGLQVNPS